MNFKKQYSKKYIKINRKLFFVLFFYIVSILFYGKSITARELTPIELDSIKKESIIVFKNFLQLWQEERYFELYEYGSVKSLELISLEEFATRMVELDWIPLRSESLKEPIVSFRYKTLLYVSTDIVFQHKNNFDLKFTKQQSFLLIKEKGKWSFDLIQMIRSPFYSPIK